MESDLVLTDVGVEATGEIRSVGQWCGLATMDRSSAHASERWVWYAEDGELRLWHSEKGNVFAMRPDGTLEVRFVNADSANLDGINVKTGMYFGINQSPVIKNLMKQVADLQAAVAKLETALTATNPNAFRGT